jgi:hypothetical protein
MRQRSPDILDAAGRIGPLSLEQMTNVRTGLLYGTTFASVRTLHSWES